MSCQNDIFVSYNWASVKTVDNLCDKLINEKKYKVWRDKNMLDNENLYEQLVKAIRRSTVFVCCITKKYATSQNCIGEINLAFSLKKPMIVLMFERYSPEELPELGGISFIINMKTRINCYTRINEKETVMGENLENEHFEQLLRFIEKYTNSVNGKSEESKAVMSNLPVRSIEFQWNSESENVFKRIGQHFKSGHQYLALSGSDGTGKSSIAYEYGHRLTLWKCDAIVICFTAETAEKLDDDYRRFAFSLNIAQGLEKNELLRQVNTKLAKITKNNRMLFIVDNLDERQIIQDYLVDLFNLKDKLKILITTRYENIVESENVLKLSLACQNFTLVKQNLRDCMTKEKHSMSYQMLQCCAYLDPDFIPLELFCELFEKNIIDIQETVASLIHRGFVQTTYKEEFVGITVCRTVQKILRRYGKREKVKILKQLAETVNVLMPKVGQVDDGTWRMAKVYFHQIERILASNEEVSLTNADLRQKQALYEQFILLEHKNALFHFTKALEISKQLLSGNHIDVAYLLRNVGSAYVSVGQLKKGLEYLEEALKMLKLIFPQNHPDVANLLNNVGCAYSSLGNIEKGLEYQEEALKMKKALETVDDSLENDTSKRTLSTIKRQKTYHCNK